jgi:two-component system sensor histidine kinase RpfC
MKDFLKSTGWTGSPEQEQGVLRIIISSAFLVYLLTSNTTDNSYAHGWTLGLYITSIFIIYSYLLFAATLIWSQYTTILRIVGICVDIGLFSYGFYITGPLSAPWYGVYLWIILGNGFRYGENYLYLSGAASLLGFGMVVLTNDYWAGHKDLAVGLTATLLIIPAYSAILIRRLNEARQRANDANRAKSDFLSRMSHEIRTPLNGILGMTELLRLKTLEPEDKECVDIIHASGNTLARQINEILDLSKIEAGQLTIEHIEFDLYALISTTLRIFKTQVDSKQLQVKENLDPMTPYLLQGDPHKLRQIIINLVGNAIKFTEKGFVSLQVHPLEFNSQRVLLRFEIIDTGIGIEPDMIDAIFDPFTQANSSVTRTYGGTGLGTTICKNLIELMGGKIGIQSTPNVGTTFWFDIPFEIASNSSATKNKSWTSECTVLYLNAGAVGDSEMANLMRTWMIPFTTATSIEKALTLIKTDDGRSTFDAIIVDGMPYNNELCNLLTDMNQNISSSVIPIVLLHSEKYPPAITGLENDRLFKITSDADNRIFYNTLHACYSRHSTEDDVLHIASRQASGQRVAGAMNILIADDNATNRVVIKRMLEKMGHICTTVSDGEEALNVMEQSDYDVVFLDKNMPGLGGIETYQAYCLAHGGTDDINFVILTADATEECRETCSEAGIELFLTKPVSLATLQNTLATLSRPNKPLPEEHSDKPAPAVLDATELPILNAKQFEELNQLSGGSTDFILEMIHNFEADAKKDFQCLESSVAKHDWPGFQDAAHALKGCALHLGLSRLAQLCLKNQNISKGYFAAHGITELRAIRRTLDDSIQAVHDKADLLGVEAQNY